jgi:ethanolamine permease
MAVLGAVPAYVLQMASFILLRLRANPDYRIGVWGAAFWFVCGVACFAIYARYRLILSPEEEFALALSAQERVGGK